MITKNNGVCACILDCLKQAAKQGDSYMEDYQLQQQCLERGWRWDAYIRGLRELMDANAIAREGRRIYLRYNLRYEEGTVRLLSELMIGDVEVPPNLDACLQEMYGNFCPEQMEAMGKAFVSDITLIFGGAGTGKTTLISGLVQLYKKLHSNKTYMSLRFISAKAQKRTESCCLWIKGFPQACTAICCIRPFPERGGKWRS